MTQSRGMTGFPVLMLPWLCTIRLFFLHYQTKKLLHTAYVNAFKDLQSVDILDTSSDCITPNNWLITMRLTSNITSPHEFRDLVLSSSLAQGLLLRLIWRPLHTSYV